MENGDQALADIRTLCDALTASRPGFHADVSLVCAQPPLDLASEAPLIASMRAACTAAGVAPTIAGLSCWTDAALFAEAGIPALCFGPGDISRAHSATEWVEIADLERATAILEAVCAGWGR